MKEGEVGPGALRIIAMGISEDPAQPVPGAVIDVRPVVTRPTARLIDIDTGEPPILTSELVFENVNPITVTIGEYMTVDEVDEDGNGIIYVRVRRAKGDEQR